MDTLLIFIWIWGAMIAMSFWEAYVEGRNAWSKRKYGWRIDLGGDFVFPAYHFYLFVIMWPLLLTLPFIMFGWDLHLFGVMISAYASGTIVEDFLWYVVNPKVKLREFWTEFSDYYPWFTVNGKKIVPLGYILGILIAIAAWLALWR